jgi:hypothetical protein
MAGRSDSSAYAAAIAKVSEAAKREGEILGHLDEILRGQAFKGSPRAQEFLRHVVHSALHGDPEDLRERSIGVGLFGRSADYDTANDAIVRVTASDVRKRLLQHYAAGTGAEPACRVSLPPGSYVPEFSFPAPAPASPPDLPAAEVQEPARYIPAATQGSRVPAIVWIASALLLVLVAGWWLTGRVWGGSTAKENLITTVFLEKPTSLQVVVADDALVLMQVLLDRRFTLEEYQNSAYLTMPELIEKKELQRFWRSLSKRQITNVGDVQNAMRIVENLRSRHLDVSVRLARQMHARAFRNGSFVILGSALSNPWAVLFEVKNTNFPYPDLPRPGFPAVILNRQPRNGEPSQFAARRNAQTGSVITYARVSLVDNLTRTGRVLLVEGQSMSATEMAGEFLLREESLAKVRSLLAVPPGEPIPDLEMILQVTEQNEVGERAELSAIRRIVPPI